MQIILGLVKNNSREKLYLYRLYQTYSRSTNSQDSFFSKVEF